jgi:hypothetical protein
MTVKGTVNYFLKKLFTKSQAIGRAQSCNGYDKDWRPQKSLFDSGRCKKVFPLP